MKFDKFKYLLLKNSLPANVFEKTLLLESDSKSMSLTIAANPAGIITRDPILPLDYLKTMPEKVLAMLESKLGMNTVVFARNCDLKKIPRNMAEDFLAAYHLMGFTQSGFNYGLFYKNDLLAVASFSKGRKMDRLPADQRSFELIRFCCRSGMTITGGLTKLVKNFAAEKAAGDIMTYVDRQLSDGKSFVRAGFKQLEDSAPVDFLIHKATFERSYDNGEAFDETQFYRSRNLGNLKLVYTPGE